MSKYCQHCGAEVQETSVFCENCGKNLTEAAVTENRQPQKGEKRCKTCGEIHDKKLKFCPNCGVNSRQLVAAKLKNCKGCDHSIAANAVKCPSCGKKTHYNLKITGLVIGILFVIIIIPSIFNSGNEVPDNTNSNAAKTEEVANNVNSDTKKTESTGQKNSILYSDDFFDIEYKKLSNAPGITATYLQLKVTNKSNQKVTLLLDDVYVNDIFIESGTGMPIELENGKISTSPFILFTGNTDLKAEDITKIEFKLKGYDDNFNVIHTTNSIIIEK